MSDAKSRFVWHELMTTDTKAGGGFFSKVAGWTTEVPSDMPFYTLFKAGKRQVAGMMALPPEAAAMHVPPNWVSYVSTSSADDTSRKAETLGGKILKAPADIPNVGRFAVLQDPQGASFAVFQPAGAPPDAPPATDFSWHELATTDWRAALNFYGSLFGWEATESMEMGPDLGTYQMYGWKGETLGGMFNKTKQMPGPPNWLPYIKVKDARTTAALVRTLGGKIVNGPMEVPGGSWIAQGLDPQGAFFAVHSDKPVVAAKPVATTKASKTAKTAPASKTKPAGKKKSAAASKKTASKKKAAPKKKAALKRKPKHK